MSNLISFLDLGVMQPIPFPFGFMELIIEYFFRLLKVSTATTIAADYGVKIDGQCLSEIQVIHFIGISLLIVEVCGARCEQPFIEMEKNCLL